MTRLLFALALVALAPAASLARQPQMISPEIPAGVVVTRDIVYAEHGERRLLLDLYRPSEPADAALPVIVAIRGGGLQAGSADKDGFGFIAAALAERGFAAVSIEYRPASEARFPAGVEDAKAAVRWARANADVYGFDPDAVGVIGGSMGGYLAASLGLTAGVAELEGAGGNPDQSSAVSAIVAMAPPADFEAMKGHPALVSILGFPFDEDPERWRLASPVTHVGPESPPALIMHSATDGAVPVSQAIALAGAYAAANRSVELVVLPDAEHAFWNYEAWFDDTMDRAAEFFRAHLGDD